MTDKMPKITITITSSTKVKPESVVNLTAGRKIIASFGTTATALVIVINPLWPKPYETSFICLDDLYGRGPTLQ